MKALTKIALTTSIVLTAPLANATAGTLKNSAGSLLDITTAQCTIFEQEIPNARMALVTLPNRTQLNGCIAMDADGHVYFLLPAERPSVHVITINPADWKPAYD